MRSIAESSGLVFYIGEDLIQIGRMKAKGIVLFLRGLGIIFGVNYKLP